MTYPNVFEKEVTDKLIARVESISTESQPEWGKMNSAQMLAHINVAYEKTFNPDNKKPGFLMRFMLNQFVKPVVVTEKPYKKNSRTSPEFLISDERELETERKKLIANMRKLQEMGAEAFDGKENRAFGQLSVDEWNTMFYKHADYHLKQFKA